MKSKLLLFVLLNFLFVSTSVYAQKITLKKPFFGGMQYSLDGINYIKVNNNATSLRLIMKDFDECLVELDRYQKRKALGMITGFPGGFLIGWPLGGYLGSGGEWKDSYNIMLAIGIPLTIISTILDHSAINCLKNAVSIYNSKQSISLNKFSINIGYQRNMNIGVNFLYSF
jgi:hypothetical protein